MTEASPTLERTEAPTTTDEGDHERLTHIVLEGFTQKDESFVALLHNGLLWAANRLPTAR